MCFYQLNSKYINHIAIINEKNEAFTYKEIFELVGEFGNSLNEEKSNKKLIFILAENNVESIIAYLAVFQFNHAVLLINSEIDKKLLNHLIEIYQPHFLWQAIENNSPNSSSVKKMFGYELISLTSNTKLHLNLNLLLSTSGTTGSPKLVKLTREGLNKNAQSIVKFLNLNDREKPITVLPLTFIYGLSVINSHLLSGGTILLNNYTLMQKNFWDFLKNNEATSIAGVPYTYQMLTRLRIFKMNLPYLKTFTLSGGKLQEELQQKWLNYTKENDKQFFIMYGQTESGGRISYVNPDISIEKMKSVGKAIEGVQLEILDESGQNIKKENCEGEIIVKSGSVMMGYAQKRTHLTNDDEQQGTLESGDMGIWDKDGFLYITGRKKRFLKILGNRVNLNEIEYFLESINIKCICAGEDNLLKIALLEKNDHKELKKVIFEKFKIQHSVIEVKEIKEIPRNKNGKILYQEI